MDNDRAFMTHELLEVLSRNPDVSMGQISDHLIGLGFHWDNVTTVDTIANWIGHADQGPWDTNQEAADAWNRRWP